jgi:uncharacterized zinc-type alcohol dehydrogenase-like protein
VGQPLEPFKYAPPELREHDVRVSVTLCGVCHTDIHAVDNYYGLTIYPFVPGHEIVGYVSAVGPAVPGLKEGDRVGIGWQGRSCMQCEWCLKGEEQLCMDIVPSGIWVPYGGFSSSVVADSRFAYPLPPAMPSQVAAVLMCAGITVYSPLRMYVAEPTQKVAIVGVGGWAIWRSSSRMPLAARSRRFPLPRRRKTRRLALAQTASLIRTTKPACDKSIMVSTC